MTIEVEDGTAKANSVAYCSLAFADAWHLIRGMTLWASMSDPEKEAAIIRAAHYMLQHYRMRWSGYRKTSAQAMDWPRYDVRKVDGPLAYGYSGYIEDDVVPVEVQQANAELAFKAASGDLAPDVARATKREKVDVIEVEYEPGSSQITRYRAIDKLLAPFLKDGGSSGVFQVSRG